MQTKDSFFQRFRQAMEERNIKQSDLAERTGIGKSAISQYAAGKYQPKQRALYLLAQALDVSEAWLMGYDVSMERNNSNVNVNVQSGDEARGKEQPKETAAFTDRDLKFALFGDAEIDDDVLEDVKELAILQLELRKKRDKKNE